MAGWCPPPRPSRGRRESPEGAPRRQRNAEERAMSGTSTLVATPVLRLGNCAAPCAPLDGVSRVSWTIVQACPPGIVRTPPRPALAGRLVCLQGTAGEDILRGPEREGNGRLAHKRPAGELLGWERSRGGCHPTVALDQARPRFEAHRAPARFAASVMRAVSSALSATGKATYVPRPPSIGRP